MNWLAPRDIAEVAALTLLNTAWHDHRIQGVHGPQDLSWNQVAGILAEQLGYAVSVVQICDNEMRQQFFGAGMPPAMADAVLGMTTRMRCDSTPKQPRTPATTTPTRLSGWIRDELIPAL